MKNKQINIVVPDEVLNRLDKVIAEHKATTGLELNRSLVVRAALLQYLNEVEKKENQ